MHRENLFLQNGKNYVKNIKTLISKLKIIQRQRKHEDDQKPKKAKIDDTNADNDNNVSPPSISINPFGLGLKSSL